MNLGGCGAVRLMASVDHLGNPKTDSTPFNNSDARWSILSVSV